MNEFDIWTRNTSSGLRFCFGCVRGVRALRKIRAFFVLLASDLSALELMSLTVLRPNASRRCAANGKSRSCLLVTLGRTLKELACTAREFIIIRSVQ